MSVQSVSQETIIPECGACHKPKTADQKMKRCGGCRLIYYCSTECQKNHWSEHKNVCQIKAAEKNGAQEKKQEPSISPEFRAQIDNALTMCWTCEKTSDKVLECLTCHAARYCSPKCQEENKHQHSLNCGTIVRRHQGLNFDDDQNKRVLIATAWRAQKKLSEFQLQLLKKCETDEDLRRVVLSKEPASKEFASQFLNK